MKFVGKAFQFDETTWVFPYNVKSNRLALL